MRQRVRSILGTPRGEESAVVELDGLVTLSRSTYFGPKEGAGNRHRCQRRSARSCAHLLTVVSPPKAHTLIGASPGGHATSKTDDQLTTGQFLLRIEIKSFACDELR